MADDSLVSRTVHLNFPPWFSFYSLLKTPRSFLGRFDPQQPSREHGVTHYHPLYINVCRFDEVELF